jgi:hypothetical protein
MQFPTTPLDKFIQTPPIARGYGTGTVQDRLVYSKSVRRIAHYYFMAAGRPADCQKLEDAAMKERRARVRHTFGESITF